MPFFIFFSKIELPKGSSSKVIEHTEVCNTIISKKATSVAFQCIKQKMTKIIIYRQLVVLYMVVRSMCILQ